CEVHRRLQATGYGRTSRKDSYGRRQIQAIVNLTELVGGFLVAARCGHQGERRTGTAQIGTKYRRMIDRERFGQAGYVLRACRLVPAVAQGFAEKVVAARFERPNQKQRALQV